MKNIYIILSQSGTFISRMLKFFSHDEFNHSSICVDDSFEKFYSFGRIKINNPFHGGFLIENAFTHVFGKFEKIPCMILKLPVTDAQYAIICATINEFIKNSKITKLINIILNILLLVTFYIMIAGFGAYFNQELGINSIIGSAILAVLSAVVFFTSVKGVLKVSEFVVPLLLFFIILIGCRNLLTIHVGADILHVKNGWLISSIVYCSYNIILLIPRLISIKSQIVKQNII